MAKHQRICAWLHVVSGVAIMLVLSVALAFFASKFAGSSVPPYLKPLLGSVGIALGTALSMVAGMELIGAVAFLSARPVGRPLLLLSAAFHTANVPVGTALAIYTFWAFFRSESSAVANSRA